MTDIIAKIWVCDDCLLTRETGDARDYDREPWSLLPNADVSLNDICTECWNSGDEDIRDICTHGRDEFSTAACDACGSILAGSRTRYAVWSWGDSE